MDRLRIAIQLGSLAKLRLRAEVLLEDNEAGLISLSPAESFMLFQVSLLR
jgi:hypothetical protein